MGWTRWIQEGKLEIWKEEGLGWGAAGVNEGGKYCYGNGPHWTTKYRISSYPPLNACIVRLFGKMDVICVSGDVRGCIIVVRWWWNENSLFFFPITDDRPRPVG